MWGNLRISALALLGAAVLGVLYHVYSLLENRGLSRPDGIVIFVRNSALPEDIGTQVLRGITAAIEASPEDDFLTNPGELPLCESSERIAARVCSLEFSLTAQDDTAETMREVARRLMAELIRRPVLGVISDGASDTDPYIIDVCRNLRIPLLLTSATADSLLAGQQDGYVFRLPSNNSKQAGTIADNVTCPAAILYEAGRYGEGLHETLLGSLPRHPKTPCIPYSFPLGSLTDLGSIIPVLKQLEVKTVVFLG